MCACEPGYTCTGCRDTPHDPRYHDDPDSPEAEAWREAWYERMRETYAD